MPRDWNSLPEDQTPAVSLIHLPKPTGSPILYITIRIIIAVVVAFIALVSIQ